MKTSRQEEHEPRDGERDQESQTAQQVVWASAAQKRCNGQIGDGLLHSIENRLGSIA